MGKVYEFRNDKAQFSSVYLKRQRFARPEEWRTIDHINPRFNYTNQRNNRTLISLPTCVAVHRIKQFVVVIDYQHAYPERNLEWMEKKIKLDMFVVRSSLLSAGHHIRVIHGHVVIGNVSNPKTDRVYSWDDSIREIREILSCSSRHFDFKHLYTDQLIDRYIHQTSSNVGQVCI